MAHTLLRSMQKRSILVHLGLVGLRMEGPVFQDVLEHAQMSTVVRIHCAFCYEAMSYETLEHVDVCGKSN